MKRQYFLLLFLLLAGQLPAQKKNAGYTKGGLSFILGGAKTSNNLTFVPAITLAPGLRIINGKEVSVSVEAPLSLGASLDEDDDFFLGFELPVAVNLNFGYGASKRSGSRIGWSAGIGKAYHFSYNEFFTGFDNEPTDELSLWGTLLQTSFFFRNKNRDGGCGFRLYWISNFSSQPVRKDVVGISLLALLE